MKPKRANGQDQIEIKQKKGTWKRFVKLFPKCRLPWIWLALYIILDIGFINLGVSETDYTAQLFAGDTSPALVTKLIAVMIINLLGSSLTVFVGAVTSARINRNMRKVVLGKVMRLPMSFFKDENPREAVYRIVQNSIVLDSTIMLFLIPLVSAVYTMAAVFQRIFRYDWRLSVIMLAFIPGVLFIAFIFGRLNFSVSERDAKLNATLMSRLSEMITNIPLAKAFAKEDYEQKRGEEYTGRLYRINITGSWISQLKDLSENALSLLQSLAITLVGLMLLNDGSITKRAWVAFFMFSSIFMGAVSSLTMLWNNIKIIQGGADRVAEIMDAPEEQRDGVPCERLQGDIHLEHVRFGYDPEKPVLNDVTCDFPDGCVTALLGASGCGKTTLVNLICRLYTPDQGAVTIDGNAIGDYALEDYRKQFAVVSQNSFLFSGSIRENICYGKGAVSEDALCTALKRAGAYEFVMDMPGQLDAVLEEYGNNLSGGQRQRLALARALLSDAPYFILDEPVAAMDALAVSEMMKVFDEIAQNRCVIVIAHTPAILRFAKRVVIIEDGSISAQGDVKDVLKMNSFLQEFSRKEAGQ
jgi:ATP-binding cassette subfamily B protein AbcA/BmrA